MIRIRRRPRSERFIQLSFEGFKPKGRNKIEQIRKIIPQFIKAVAFYFVKRIKSSFSFVGSSARFFNENTRKLKRFVVRKLIWSRGRLGRPIANLIIMAVAFLVFTFGEVFNSSKLVNSQEINEGYLSNVTDIIPQRNTATTLVPDSRKQNESFTYVVEGGDTLSAIGNKFKISADAIEYVNGLSSGSVLKVGQELTIPPVSGLIHTVEDDDTLESIAETYDVPLQAIADFNYILDIENLTVGSELVIPNASVPQPAAPVIPFTPPTFGAPPVSAPAPSGGFSCAWPTTTRLITQYFYWYHNGLDIAVPWSSAMPPIFACNTGVVVRSGWNPYGLGLHVVIDHGNGFETTYGHMSRIDVGYGQQVGRGQQIGVMGNTGRSTGPHVHYTVKYNGVAQDPLIYTN